MISLFLLDVDWSCLGLGFFVGYLVHTCLSMARVLYRDPSLEEDPPELNPWCSSPTVYADVSREELYDALNKCHSDFENLRIPPIDGTDEAAPMLKTDP